MFDLLTNILVWVVAIPLFILLFKNIPKDWIRYIGWAILVALLLIAFASVRVVDEPVPRFIIELLTFPFRLIGIILILLFFNWRKIKDQKPRNLEAKFVGDKVDNSKVANAIKEVSQGLFSFFSAFVILAVASNNAFSELLGCYFTQQADNAVEQAYRRPVKSMTDLDLAYLRRDIFDVIDVPASDSPYELRLLNVAENWHRPELQPKPLVVLHGGNASDRSAEGYPCGIDAENTTRNSADVRNDVLGRNGLKFDPRYENFFTAPNANRDPLPKVRLTQADDMCEFLTQKLSNLSIPRSFIILEPNSINIRRSVERYKEFLQRKGDKQLINPREPRTEIRTLIVTPAIETSRAFMAFKREDLNIVPLPTTDSNLCIAEPNERPWPLQPRFKFKPEYLFFSAHSFYRSELVWSEVKELFLYTLRFWIRPPLTDERPYFPKSLTNPPQPTSTPSPSR